VTHKVPSRHPLTQRTRDCVAVMFPTAREKVAELLMRECGNNLPFLEDADALALERPRFAALRVSEGRFDKLKSAIELAKIDWRDLLMAAGFGEDAEAHLRWKPTPASAMKNEPNQQE
jgi:hypothetical protein